MILFRFNLELLSQHNFLTSLIYLLILGLRNIILLL